MPATIAIKLPSGSYHTASVPERASVRHALAADCENVRASAAGWDHTPHPYTNWGYQNRLDYTLAKFKEGGIR